MTNISAEDINKLRKMSGVGLMDCKAALIESEGDFDKAIEILRKKGQKVASRRADRETTEGIAIARTSEDKTFAVGFILGCETDFVSNSEDFAKATEAIMQTAIENQAKSKEELMKLQLVNQNATVESLINDLLGKIQEKIEVFQYKYIESPYVTAYNHHNKKLSTLVAFNKSDVAELEEAGKDIAMQTAAMAPIAINENDVSKDIIQKELEIAKEQIRQEGKPENLIDKIAQGKLNKFFKENVLLNQQFIKDNNITVKSYLESKDKELSVTKFIRISF